MNCRLAPEQIDNSSIMRAVIIEAALEGLLARARSGSQLDDSNIREVVEPVWLIAGELKMELMEMRHRGTPPGRESRIRP